MDMPELHMKFIHSNRDTPREKTYVPGRLTEATKSDNVQMAGYLIGKDQKKKQTNGLSMPKDWPVQSEITQALLVQTPNVCTWLLE